MDDKIARGMEGNTSAAGVSKLIREIHDGFKCYADRRWQLSAIVDAWMPDPCA